MILFANLLLIFTIFTKIFAEFSHAETASSVSRCDLNISTDDDDENINNRKFLPILIRNASHTYELVHPTINGIINIQKGQNLSFLCSGERNYVVPTNANISTFTCLGENRMKLFRLVVNINEIRCKNPSVPERKSTDEMCKNKNHEKGHIFEIGLKLSRTEWIVLLTECYSDNLNKVLYRKIKNYEKLPEYILKHDELKTDDHNYFYPEVSDDNDDDNDLPNIVITQ